MFDEAFILNFKRRTEDEWQQGDVDPRMPVFQFQKGTQWNPGLSDAEIRQYESKLGLTFSADIRLFLSYMNGTDLPMQNLCAEHGSRPGTAVGVYSYPRDLNLVRGQIAMLTEHWKDDQAILTRVGIKGSDGKLFPFTNGCYVVCGRDITKDAVLMVTGKYVTVLAANFREYLEKRF